MGVDRMVNKGRGFSPARTHTARSRCATGGRCKIADPRARRIAHLLLDAVAEAGAGRARAASVALCAGGLFVIAALIGLAYSGSRQELAEGTRVAGSTWAGFRGAPQWRGSTPGSAGGRDALTFTAGDGSSCSPRISLRSSPTGERRLPLPGAPGTASARSAGFADCARGSSAPRCFLDSLCRARRSNSPRRDRDAGRSHSSERRARAARLAGRDGPGARGSPARAGCRRRGHRSSAGTARPLECSGALPVAVAPAPVTTEMLASAARRARVAVSGRSS